MAVRARRFTPITRVSWQQVMSSRMQPAFKNDRGVHPFQRELSRSFEAERVSKRQLETIAMRQCWSCLRMIDARYVHLDERRSLVASLRGSFSKLSGIDCIIDSVIERDLGVGVRRGVNAWRFVVRLTRISASATAMARQWHLLSPNWIKCRRCGFDETASRRAWHLQFRHVVQSDSPRSDVLRKAADVTLAFAANLPLAKKKIYIHIHILLTQWGLESKQLDTRYFRSMKRPWECNLR